MLIGEFSTVLGDKNRIAIPKRLRDRLNGKIFVTRGYEKCLILIDESRWESLIQEVNKKPLLHMSVRDTKRYLLGGAVEVEYDSQGRFVMPESLKKFATIDSKVTFLGLNEWIEIWAEEKWLEKLQNLSTHAGEIAERLSI